MLNGREWDEETFALVLQHLEKGALATVLLLSLLLLHYSHI